MALPNDKRHRPMMRPNNTAQWRGQMALINYMSSGPPNDTAKSQTHNIMFGDISEPVFKGFLSDGIDRVSYDLVLAAFVMYDPYFLKALPSAFQGSIRKTLNQQYLKPTIAENTKVCQPVAIQDRFVDFRDLLLDPDTARQQGDSGKSPYGNIFPTLYKVLSDRMTFKESDGLPGINSVMVCPLSRSQSGVMDCFALPTNYWIVNYASNATDFFCSIQLAISNITIENVDTIQTLDNEQ